MQNRQQEIGRIRRENGGISWKQVSACQSVCVAFRRFFLRAVFFGFLAEISAAGAFRQKVLPPEGLYIYIYNTYIVYERVSV